jgi:hypothetical protein
MNAASVVGATFRDTSDSEIPEVSGPDGLGGGIALFQALIAGQVILFSFGFLSAGAGLFDVLVLCGILAFPLVGFYLTANRNHHAPAYWTVYLTVGIAASVFMGLARDPSAFLGGALVFPWLIYWRRSKRVRATFRQL